MELFRTPVRTLTGLYTHCSVSQLLAVQFTLLSFIQIRPFIHIRSFLPILYSLSLSLSHFSSLFHSFSLCISHFAGQWVHSSPFTHSLTTTTITSHHYCHYLPSSSTFDTCITSQEETKITRIYHLHITHYTLHMKHIYPDSKATGNCD